MVQWNDSNGTDEISDNVTKNEEILSRHNQMSFKRHKVDDIIPYCYFSI